MIKKSITYTDYNGEERKEDYYFNLNRRELERWEISTPGGLDKRIQRILDKKDAPELINFFYDMLSKSYGEKTDDGRYLIKRRNGVDLFELFEQSPAFDVLYEELCENIDYAISFFNSMMDIPNTDAASAIPSSIKSGDK